MSLKPNTPNDPDEPTREAPAYRPLRAERNLVMRGADVVAMVYVARGREEEAEYLARIFSKAERLKTVLENIRDLKLVLPTDVGPSLGWAVRLAEAALAGL